jgi:hypothetical protein
MSADGIFMDGDEFFPSDVQKTITKIGVSLAMADGSRRWVQRANKHTWAISWERVNVFVRGAVEAVALLGTTFAFVDQDGFSHTVQCEADAYSDSVAAISPDNTLYYDISLTVLEA